MDESLDSKRFRRACGQFLTGVTIVTSRSADGTPHGVTVNSFTSVSLNPPLVLVCLDKKLGSYHAFRVGQPYAVHVLAEDQRDLSTRFARRGADKFAGLQCKEGFGKVPVLANHLALLECSVVHAYDGGDHTIFIGKVERLEVAQSDRLPLGFFRGSYVQLQKQRSTFPSQEVRASTNDAFLDLVHLENREVG